MSRLAPVLAVALLAVGCSRKEEVVVAAPTTPPPPTAAPAHAAGGQPSQGDGVALPPGHPPLDANAGTGSPAQGDGMGTLPPGHPSLDAPGAQDQGMGMPGAPAHGAAMSAGGEVGDVKVPKATGPDARTVAELFAQRTALKDHTVSLRGKVVKYTPGVMGKNWLHLRDGTGTPGKDNDVTVTTQDAAAKGDVVVVRGKVALDQDIGMGAPYPVIIQDAKITK